MRTLFFVFAILCAASAGAQTRDTVTLTPGQAVRVELAEQGVTVTSDRAPELNDFDRDFVDKIRRAYATNDSFVLGDAEPAHPAPPIAPRSARIGFVLLDGKEALLIIENGYDEGFVYRARMTLRGETKPTDVCLVMPGKRGYEHWPHPIDSIELSDIRLEHWDSGMSLPCA